MRKSLVPIAAVLFAGAPLIFAQSAGPSPAPLINPTGQDAQPAAQRGNPGDAKPLSPNSSVDDVLDALDARGLNLREFVADVSLAEIDEATQLDFVRTGKVLFQKQKDDDRIRVNFADKAEGRFAKPDKVEYLLDDGWLIDRDYQRSVEVKRQVLRPGEKVNLLKLGEGPFPLPIGQPKADVYKEFDVSKGAPGADAPKGTVHVTLKPREGTRLARKFKVIDVWVDPKINMPVRIEVLDVNETTRRQTNLTNIKVNPDPPLTDRDFALPRVDQTKWELHTEPFED
jgi:outer membrane lipoprotein-sorting protein